MKKKILERIEELEERNKVSREFVRMLDENNKEDKKIIENEQKDRCYRIAIIMEYKMLLEGEI